MKKLFYLIGFLTLTLPAKLLAQDGLTGFNYQAVVRNTDGTVVSGQHVNLRFSILKGSASGPEVYVETQALTTNQLGLITHIVGRGSSVTGTFTGIDFSSADLYLRSAEHTSELPSLMRTSYAVFCLKKKK